MNTDLPVTRDLVLIGGGHAHALMLRRWGMKPLPGVRLTVIDPNVKAPYTGMLPGHVAGHYPRDALDIDLLRLAQFAGARLVQDRAVGLDRAARLVQLARRPAIAYDHLSIDIGISSVPLEIEGFDRHGIAAKPLGPFAEAWERYVAAVAGSGEVPRVALIGAGVGAVELALAMHHRLRAVGAARPEITLLDAGKALQGTAPGTRRALWEALWQAGIKLREHVDVAAVTPDAVRLADGTLIAARLVVGAAGARPWGWLAQSGLPLKDGFIEVDEWLRVVDDPAIYAVGDCAHIRHAPRPKAGVYAVRAAPILTHNLRADLTGAQRRIFNPQADFLKLVSLGGKQALADRGGVGLSLPGLWRWKDWIDQRFMEKFRDLPDMPAPVVPQDVANGVRAEMADHPVICGGCGAKVGPGALGGMIAELAPVARDDVLSLPGDDAGVLRIGGQTQVLSTDHLRAFTADPWAMARITAVHALGDVWAMGAEPQSALVNVILPRMANRQQRHTLREIMAGAAEVMADAGAAIIGGHTTQGREMTIGFTVTGLCRNAPIGLGGARPGDRLILTKPLGTGIILAAAMAAKADGDVVARAMASMERPLAQDSGILRADARAMTDVTGFGLAGHLLAIMQASGCGAMLRLADVPLLDGVAALVERRIASSLQGANAAHAMPYIDGAEPPEWLFDPQTAGGLLAAVPSDKAGPCLDALRAAGIDAVEIGEVTDDSARLLLR